MDVGPLLCFNDPFDGTCDVFVLEYFEGFENVLLTSLDGIPLIATYCLLDRSATVTSRSQRRKTTKCFSGSST